MFPFPSDTGFDNSSYVSDLLSGIDLYDRPSQAIELQGSDRDRFFNYVFHAYDQSMSRHMSWHRQIRQFRAVFQLVKRKASLDSDEEPNLYTAPGSANKVTGVSAHIIEGIEQPEILSVAPFRGVKSLDDVTEVCRRVGAYMNREIELSSSREIIVQDMPKEAVGMGSAFSPLVLGDTPINGEYFWQWSPLIPIEDVLIDNWTARFIWQTNIFWLQRHIMNDLLPLADQGIIDKNEADKLYMMGSNVEQSFQEEFMGAGVNNSLDYKDDNEALHLRYGYYRFRPSGKRKSEYWYTIFDPQKRIGLAAMRSPFADIADIPAMNVGRTGKMVGRFYGRGVIERLMPVQEMTDRELNNYLATSDWNASPPFEYQQSSAFGQAYAKKGGKMRLMAGLGIPTLNQPGQQSVRTIEYNNNAGGFFGNMSLLSSFEDDATYTDPFLGQNDSRKTLGEFQISVNKGNLKLKLDLSDFDYDMNLNFKMYYSAILFKIKYQGVVQVHDGGDLLAYKDIPIDAIDEQLTSMLMQYYSGGLADGEEVLKALEQFSGRMSQGKIPGAKRSDIDIRLKGTKILADKMGDFMKLEKVLPTIATWYQAASQDSKMWYNLRTFLEAADIQDIDKRIPEDPNKYMNPDEVFQLLVPYLEFMRSQSTI